MVVKCPEVVLCEPIPSGLARLSLVRAEVTGPHLGYNLRIWGVWGRAPAGCGAEPREENFH